MTTLRTAAQQALEALEEYQSKGAPFLACDGAVAALRDALAQQAEPVAWLQPRTVDGHLRPDLGYEACSSADYGAFPVYRVPPRCPHCASLEAQNNELDRKLAEMERADLSRCPQCGGPADNGHDRSIPPNPYLCTKCMAEPVAEIIESEIKVDSHQTLDEAMQQPRAMAQAYESGYNAGVANEREACAQACEARFMGDMTREDMEARRCAAAIRARGEMP